MKCPHCGYVLDVFDLICPRCKRKPIEAPTPPSALEEAENADGEGESAELPEVRQEVLEQRDEQKKAPPVQATGASSIVPGNAPSPQPNQVATPVGSSSLSSALVCPCCQKDDVQRVSAIHSAGSWSGSSSWDTRGSVETDTVGLNFGRIDGPHSHANTFGVNTAHTSGHTAQHGFESSSGATNLARTLAPPLPPSTPVKKGISERAGCWFVGLPVVFFMLWGGGLSGFICWPVILITLIVWWATWDTNKRENQRDQEGFPILQKDFERKWARWNALYYCRRCDAVFDPASGRNAPATNIRTLL